MIAMEVKVGDTRPTTLTSTSTALTGVRTQRTVPDKEGLYHSATPKAPYDPPFYDRVYEPQQTRNIINSVLPTLRSEVFMAPTAVNNRLDFIAQKAS